MTTSPASSSAAMPWTVDSVISPAGTIAQTARGALSFEASSSSDEAPSAPSATRASIGGGLDVVDDATVAGRHQTAGDVRPHPA